jgi:tRNA-Thr(GGU) m(6)t(6)A37 methyltransferase TsaA
MAGSDYQVHPIGRVRSPLVDLDGPKQADEGAPAADIVLSEEYADGLEGLQVGDAILVLTWLHRARRDVLVVHPRDDATRPEQGVFGTRSADRPNPIGLHRVEIIAIDGATLRVGELEAIDGTPVIDIKVTIGRADER